LTHSKKFTKEQILEAILKACPSPDPDLLNLELAVSAASNNLSRGQRQILFVARALLKGSKFLVMDEATSSINSVQDAEIQKKLCNLPCTITKIAHDLEGIMNYDRVFIFDNGHVVEEESPCDLLEKPEGYFHALAQASHKFPELKQLGLSVTMPSIRNKGEGGEVERDGMQVKSQLGE
jgi:ABC-type multidrug transport system fused ATPase/permease subunit